MATNFSIIFIAIIAGVLIRRYKLLPENSHKVVNLWVISVALPAISLRYIPKLEWDPDMIFLLSIPWVLFIFAYLLLELLSKFKPLDIKTKACILLTVGFSNLSFLGFPLTEAYYGKEGLKLAIICDQAGFIAVSTLGILTATYATSKAEKFSFYNLLKKIISFPPTVAFLAAFIIPKFINYGIIEPILDPIFDSLGATMVPMALFSVGLQLQFKEWKTDRTLLLYTLGYKLLIAPSLILIISLLASTEKLFSQVGTIEAAMAPLITGSIIATEFNLRPKLSSLILSFGIIISFFTTFLWFILLK